MHIKYIFRGLLALVIASAAWSLVRSVGWDQWLRSRAEPAPSIQFQNDGPELQGLETTLDTAPAAAGSAESRITAGMRKCKRGATVVYTDRNCPTGSQQKPIGGSMTVVNGAPSSY